MEPIQARKREFLYFTNISLIGGIGIMLYDGDWHQLKPTMIIGNSEYIPLSIGFIAKLNLPPVIELQVLKSIL